MTILRQDRVAKPWQGSMSIPSTEALMAWGAVGIIWRRPDPS
jgi:hypothetical protein